MYLIMLHFTLNTTLMPTELGSCLVEFQLRTPILLLLPRELSCRRLFMDRYSVESPAMVTNSCLPMVNMLTLVLSRLTERTMRLL